jgi:EAL domain-containing protein (putative c-di-GMP-specific phosphodiesterase class I)
LKVDQRFVLRSSTSAGRRDHRAYRRELAHRLGLVAVAEGVENQELLDRMVAFDFDISRGTTWPDR